MFQQLGTGNLYRSPLSEEFIGRERTLSLRSRFMLQTVSQPTYHLLPASPSHVMTEGHLACLEIECFSVFGHHLDEMSDLSLDVTLGGLPVFFTTITCTLAFS